jgi:ADP-ribose pyrophosphatase YjhB (NUDIX family)
MSKRDIEVLARGVCVVEGQVLLCYTRGAENTYLPGGHVDFGERTAEALCREIREEMDLESLAGRFLGVVEHEFDQKGEPHCEINLVFELRIPGLRPDGEPPSVEAHLGFLWVPADPDALRAAHLEPAPLCDLVPAWSQGAAPAFASTLPA